MTSKLDMKVTISEVVTPTLYQMMKSIKEPHERASVLKHAAESYLRGLSVASLPPSSILLRMASAGPLPSVLPGVASIEKADPTRSTHGGESPVAEVKGAAPAATDNDYKFDDIGATFAGFT